MALLEENKAIKEQVSALNKAMAIAESAASPQQALDADEWDRPPRLHVLEHGPADNMARHDVLEVARTWLVDAGFPESQWSLVMPNSSRRATIVFQGEAMLAARWARAANFALRIEDGSRTKLTVPNPNPAADGQPLPLLPLFVSPDTRPKSKTQTRAGKKITAILKEECPGQNFEFHKASAMVTYNRQDLCTFVGDSRETLAPLWKNAVLQQSGINKERVSNALGTQLAPTRSQPSASDPEWSL